MEEIIDKKFEQIQVVLDKQMKGYLTMQREMFQEDLDTKLGKIETRLFEHDQLIHKHSKDIQLLKVA